jgi:hypothetical protein
MLTISPKKTPAGTNGAFSTSILISEPGPESIHHPEQKKSLPISLCAIHPIFGPGKFFSNLSVEIFKRGWQILQGTAKPARRRLGSCVCRNSWGDRCFDSDAELARSTPGQPVTGSPSLPETQSHWSRSAGTRGSFVSAVLNLR